MRWIDVDMNLLDLFVFADDSLSEAGNFCRNPDNSVSGPWCYVDLDRTRENCLVPQMGKFVKFVLLVITSISRDFK